MFNFLKAVFLFFTPHFQTVRVAVVFDDPEDEYAGCTVVAMEEGITVDLDYDALGTTTAFTWFGCYIGGGSVTLDE